MGRFKKEKFTASDTGKKFFIFTPTIMKKGKNIVVVKGKTESFVKARRTKR